MRHHGHAPSDGSEMRAFYQVFALSELSARLGYTTSQETLLLEYLPSSYSTFREHAVHIARWPALLSSKGEALYIPRSFDILTLRFHGAPTNC